MNGRKAITGIAIIALALNLGSQSWAGKDDNKGGQKKLQKFEAKCEGIRMMLEGENGDPREFVLPVKNPKALKHWNKWAAKHGCPSPSPEPGEETPPPPPPAPVPTALTVNDMNGASETIAGGRGMIAFITRLNGLFGNTLAHLFLSPHLGQTYVDGDTNESGYPLAAMTVADYVGEGDIVILPGETITIQYDGGQTTTFTFTQGLTVPSLSAVIIYAATVNGEGRFYWDEALTDPL